VNCTSEDASIVVLVIADGEREGILARYTPVLRGWAYQLHTRSFELLSQPLLDPYETEPRNPQPGIRDVFATINDVCKGRWGFNGRDMIDGVVTLIFEDERDAAVFRLADRW
jgi:hypothetical protein